MQGVVIFVNSIVDYKDRYNNYKDLPTIAVDNDYKPKKGTTDQPQFLKFKNENGELLKEVYGYNMTMLRAHHDQGGESTLRTWARETMAGSDVVVIFVLEENEVTEAKTLVNEIFKPDVKGKGKATA